MEAVSLSSHRHTVSNIEYKITNVLVFFLFYNLAFKELYCHTVCPLIIGEMVGQPIITQKFFFKDCNNVSSGCIVNRTVILYAMRFHDDPFV